MATRRMARDESDAVLRVSDELSARLVHRDYRARPSRQWSLVEVGGPSLRLVLTIGEAERLRDALEVLLRQVPSAEQTTLIALPVTSATGRRRRMVRCQDDHGSRE